MTFKASYCQERIWSAGRPGTGTGATRGWDSTVPNVPLVLGIGGVLQPAPLRAAIEKVTARHEALRTGFTFTDNELCQVIQPAVWFELPLIEATGEEEEQIIARAEASCRTPFDAGAGHLLRGQLIRTGELQHYLVLVFHPLVVDRASLRIIANEIMICYEAFVREAPPQLPEVRLHYVDFAGWQRELPRQVLDNQAFYWKGKIGDEIHAPRLLAPTVSGDRPFEPARHPFRLSAASAEFIRRYSRQAGVPVVEVVLAALKILLHKYSGATRITVGTCSDNRSHPSLQEVVGPLANPIVLATDVEATASFAETLGQVSKILEEAGQCKDLPFETLLRELDIDPAGPVPLFNVLFAYEAGPVRLPQPANLKVSWLETNLGWAACDISLLITDGPDVISGVLVYNAQRFSGAFISQFTGHLDNLCGALAGREDQPVRSLAILSGEEYQRLSDGFNNTGVAIDDPRSVQEIFEDHAAATPDATALVCGDRKISYREANERANQLAHALRQKHGVRPDDLVGVMLQPTESLIITLLGIIKSGAAFVPIDPAYPAARISYILTDSRVKLAIADPGTPMVPAGSGVVPLDELTAQARAFPATNPAVVKRQENLSYVIYTSGSTGQPKGAGIEERSLLNYCHCIRAAFSITARDSSVLLASYAFDGVYTTVWGMLLSGGTLHVVDRPVMQAPDLLLNYLSENAISCIKITPSHFRALLNSDDFAAGTPHLQLRKIIFGGEPIQVDDLRKYHALYPQCRFVNHYGPTETTIGCAYHLIDADDLDNYQVHPVIGRPFINTRLYITDADGGLVPVGVTGELAISGAGVGRGYLYSPQLTAPKFGPDPFCPGARMYRTGDLARRLADGTIELLGRADDQVKIRGYRIALGEIRAGLLTYPGVKDAAVISRPDHENDHYLAAYLTSDLPVDTARLRHFLTTQLPAFMVPQYVTVLDHLPLTAHGKLDYRALPDPAAATAGDALAPLTGELETKLAEIWCQVLALSRVGAGDDFFRIGGHSLKAVRVVSRIFRTLGVRLTVKDIFEHPTIERLAALVGQKQKIAYQGLAKAEERPFYPLSPGQRRLWVASQPEHFKTAYTIFEAYTMEGALDVAAFGRALTALVKRHEVLRTTFHTVDGEPVQRVHPASEAQFDLAELDLRGRPDRLEQVRQIARADASAAIDLEYGPLVKGKLIRTEERSYQFLFTIHHIISDGWSTDVLIAEIITLYNAYRSGGEPGLPPLPIQYKDFVQWQHNALHGGELEEARRYWLGQFPAGVPPLELPTDRVRPARRTLNGATVRGLVGPDRSQAIKGFCQANDITLYTFLVSVTKCLLYKYTGRQDIVVGIPVAGRPHLDLEQQAGLYLNNLPIRTGFDAGESFERLASRVKESLVNAYQHEQYPFDLLVADLGIPYDAGRNPLFDVAVVFQNNVLHNQATLRMDGVALEKFRTDHTISTLDVRIEFTETDGGIQVVIDYNTDLFAPARMERMLAHLESLTGAVLAGSQVALHALEYLTAAERQQILVDFNRTGTGLPAQQTMVEVFEEAVDRYPDRPALVFEDTTLTYAQLNDKVNCLAHHLRDTCGLGPNQVAAVMLSRSELPVIAILAVLKAGAAYLPVDPAMPSDRKAFLLSDAGALLLITESEFLLDLDCYDGKLFAIDIELAGLAGKPANPVRVNTGADTAYVIYTSGSTGRPKGVAIAHRSNVNMSLEQVKKFGLTPSDAVLQFASLSFDASVSEICMALYAGARLVMVREETIRDAQRLLAGMKAGRITVITLPPSYLSAFEGKDLAFLRVVITAGEAANVRQAVDVARYCNYFNAYGPTECAVCVSIYQVTSRDAAARSIPIGRPIGNMQTYVFDAAMRPVPVGVTGDLYVAGIGLSKGYLNRERENAERFIEHPFAPGSKLYKTGDQACWLPNGNLEFRGRSDFQLKVRGYRIEAGEIESHLRQHDQVDEAVAMLTPGEAGSQLLVACYQSAGPIDRNELKRLLARQLPHYAVPDQYVWWAQFPLNLNGKVDRRALLDGLRSQEVEVPYQAPATPLEELLAGVWQATLGRDAVSVTADFFEAGGDSIKAIQIAARLHKLGYKVEVKDVFKYPTIGQLAQKAERLSQKPASRAVAGRVPLTPIQAAFFASPNPGKHHYNQSVLLHVGKLPEELIRSVFEKLLDHHDALRMRYAFREGRVEQVIGASPQPLSLRVFTLEEDGQVPDQELERLQGGLDLENGPLLRLGLFTGKEANYLFIVIHHLVVDAVAWRILLEDVQYLLEQHSRGEALCLPAKTDSFQDWAVGLAGYAESPALLAQAAYWRQVAAEAVPAPPADFPGAPARVKDNQKYTFRLAAPATGQLTALNKATGATVEELLVAALATAVKQTFGCQKLMLALEGHGREEVAEGINVTRTVGWFTSVYPVVIDTDAPGGFGPHVTAVREALRRVPNKGIGYGVLRYLADPAKAGAVEVDLRNAVGFNYLGQYDADVARNSFITGYTGNDFNVDPQWQREHLLEVSGGILDGQLQMTITFSGRQFLATTIRQLGQSFEEALTGLIGYCASRPGRFLSPADLTYADLPAAELSRLRSRYEVEDVCPLSPMQEAIFYSTLIDQIEHVYFVHSLYRLRGALNLEAVRYAINQLARRHEVLRTVFVQGSRGESLQVVLQKQELEVHYEDWRALAGPGQADRLRAFVSRDRQRNFALDTGPIMRLAVLQLADDAWQFVWSHHHLLMDGWSVSVLVNEFFTLYGSYCAGTPAQLLPAPRYSAYLRWLAGQNGEASVRYWRQYLDGYHQRAGVPRLRLPEGQGYEKGQYRTRLDAATTAGLNALARKNQVTLNTLLQTLWGVLVSKYNGTRDVVFGAVTSGRSCGVERVDSTVGLFINTVPVRIRYGAGERFSEVVRRVQAESAESEPNAYLPLAAIQAENALRQSLFDHLVVFENYPAADQIEGAAGPGAPRLLTLEETEVWEQNNFDFNLVIQPGEELSVKCDYNRKVYDEGLVEKLLEQFRQLAGALIGQDHPVDELSLLTPRDRHQLLVDFNAARAGYTTAGTAVERFEAVAARQPGATALTFRGRRLTYAQVNESANQLAHCLRTQYRVQPDQLVGLVTGRSERMIIAMLGILKAGAAFLPIDPELPAQRVKYLVEAASPVAIVAERKQLLGDDLARDPRVFCLDGHREDLLLCPVANPDPVNQAGDLMYVLYTSGSTGKPKGVMVEHGGLVNMALAQIAFTGIHAADRVLQFSSLSFDASLSEVFIALFSGACLTVFDRQLVSDPAAFRHLLRQEDITVLSVTPSYLNVIGPEDLGPVRILITGGEAANPRLAEACSRFLAYFNGYGPTECSVCTSMHRVTPGSGRVSIGRPIPNCQVYILDEHQRLLPVGAVGEICISGAGLARGYLNQPELTAEKFIENPFRPGTRLYRTGDAGRWLPNGEIDFAGRLDHQVKVRGHRVEPGEIETTLRQQPGVADATVVARTTPDGETYLVAFYTPREPAPPDAVLREHLGRHLPAYMVPSVLVALPQMPHTVSGKTDRRALAGYPLPAVAEAVAFAEWADPIEKQLAGLWSGVLEHQQFGLHDNFFDVGGNSIKLIRLYHQVSEAFPGQLKVSELYSHSTIALLAARLGAAPEAGLPPEPALTELEF